MSLDEKVTSVYGANPMSPSCCSPGFRLMRTLHMLHSNFFKALLSCQICHDRPFDPPKTTAVVCLLGEVDFNSNFVWNAFLCCSLQVSHRKPTEANRKSHKNAQKKATPVRRLKNQKVHTLLAHLRQKVEARNPVDPQPMSCVF